MTPDEAFDTFPRRDLSIKIGRRQALLTVATELEAREGHRGGKPAFKLSALGHLADELLALVSPVPMPGCEIAEKDGFVWACFEESHEPLLLFSSASPARSVVHRFDGRSMLEVIARHVAAEMNWDEARGFAYVRGVFLHLTELGVCVPH